MYNWFRKNTRCITRHITNIIQICMCSISVPLKMQGSWVFICSYSTSKWCKKRRIHVFVLHIVRGNHPKVHTSFTLLVHIGAKHTIMFNWDFGFLYVKKELYFNTASRICLQCKDFEGELNTYLTNNIFHFPMAILKLLQKSKAIDL